MQMQTTASHTAQTERNSRFKAICRNIETTEHEIHVHSRKLDRLKKKLMMVCFDNNIPNIPIGIFKYNYLA